MTNTEKHRNRQRHRHIKLVADIKLLTLRGLHKDFCAQAKKRGEAGCHYSVYCRVLRGERTSERIRRHVSRRLRIAHKELWA